MNFQEKRENRIAANREQEQGIEARYSVATDLLEDIWLHIDWDGMNRGRMMKIWDEFENQVKALSKCYSRLEPFIDKICKRFHSYCNQYETKEILAGEHEEILNVFRTETQIPMLLLRLRRENAKTQKNEEI